MASRRILVIGLDGFDLALAERFQAEGLLPNFERFQQQAACFKLDHGRDKYSGLAWEHLSSGVAPRDGGRWSAVTFDKKTYTASQDHTVARPFLSDLSARTVVFDFPYLDLSLAPNVRGITSWGAHDPGVAPASRPDGLHGELNSRFGPYPATEWIYGFCWPSVEKTQAAGKALVQATDLRSQVSRWLLSERLPDWNLGVVVVSEGHSAIEPLFHGVDQTHPLHTIDSAPAAAAGLRNVYCAMDKMIGDLCQEFPDATLLLVAMHGMGPNDSDVPAMVLLPELLYRFAFGSPYMRPIPFPGLLPDGTPLLSPDESSHEVLKQSIPLYRSSADKLARWMNRMGVHLQRPASPTHLDWMAAARYSPFWPRMKAFALPSFYDGRIRLNVVGREAKGLVKPHQYESVCNQIAELISGCRNLLTGKKVASEIYAPKKNPHDVGPSEADLYIIWEGAPLGFKSPQFGAIGPAPYLRTGGHTGQHGFLSILSSDLRAGNYGVASSFNVVPTIVQLLGETPKPGISGRSLVQEIVNA
jgi:predicted AlkP superfamily phosphohydrolase/phosphomutase